jgi:hypothetical protein
MAQVLVRSGKPVLDFSQIMSLDAQHKLTLCAQNNPENFLDKLLANELDALSRIEEIEAQGEEKEKKMIGYLIVAMISAVKDKKVNLWVEKFANSRFLFSQVRVPVLGMLYHTLQDKEAKVTAMIALLNAVNNEEGAMVDFDVQKVPAWLEEWKIEKNLAVKALKLTIVYLEKNSGK